MDQEIINSKTCMMKKRIILFILIINICLYNLFGEESGKNVIYGGISTSTNGINLGIGLFLPFFIIGINLEYERLFNNMFSIGLDVGLDPVVTPYVEMKGRWYPWSKSFFLGISSGIWKFMLVSPIRVSVSTTFGWKICVGNKWFIMPNITSRFLIPRNNSSKHSLNDIYGDLIRINFSIGYKF